MRICLQFEHIGFEQHLVEQLSHADALLGTDVLALVLTAPFFHQVVEVGKFFLNLVRVSAWLINLVDCENDRHTGSGSMVECFHGLRHHSIISSHDDDNDVGNLCTTGTHSGKRLVTRGVEECDAAAVFQFHIICADVLGDTTSLTSNHVSVTDVVEQ